MNRFSACTLFANFLFFLNLFLLPPRVLAIETLVKDFGLSPTKPYVDTGLDIRVGDILNFRHQSGQITIQGSSYRWLASVGDPTCIADSEYTLPGYNCWSLVGRIGNAPPFYAATNILGGLKTIYALNPGRLYLGINHKLPLLGFGGWSIRLIKNYFPPPPPPTPFLDLPWDYQSNGKSFSDAALTINSFFDHAYPLLSASSTINEPEGSYPEIINLFGKKVLDPYSSHDGYDYGRLAGTPINTPLIAPANGCASYIYNNAVGNAIHIDHHNYYQTRYYHLQPDGLVTTSPSGCVEVVSGQQIGLVGSTGNSTGPHLHFMVVEDKNRDGNFGDNIPDGVTDPFGWQSLDPDPWENYQFNYLGAERIGNKSNYLWKHPIPNLNPILKSNAAYFEFEKAKIEFDSGSVKEDTQLKLLKAPWFKISETIHSVSSSLQITAHNLFGTPVTQFLKPFSLSFNISDLDLSLYKPETLRIYSSSDGQNWTQEDTVLDWQALTAEASIDHLTYFVLAAEAKDTTPPTTTISADKEEVEENTFAEPVSIVLSATDNSDGSGVDYTLYRIEGGDWVKYQESLSFTEDGDYQIQYYSGDLFENIEPIQTYNLKIDSSLAVVPELVTNFNHHTLMPEFIASPSGEVISLHLSEQNWQAQIKKGSRDTVLNYNFSNQNDIYKYQFLNIIYHADPSIFLPINEFQMNIHKDKNGNLQNFQQILKLEDKTVFVGYVNKQNKTQFVEIYLGSEQTHQTLSGMHTLQLYTDKGKLNYQLIPSN